MSIYAIADLHLSLAVDKPMDVFGKRWDNYMNKIEEEWKACIKENDTVILPGDFSWSTYLSQSLLDFKFLEALPGKKIMLKGNHDYWWSTSSKLKAFCRDNNFNSIDFLQNNSFIIDDVAICGTRGWKLPVDEGFSNEDKKIFNREIQRFILSVDSMNKSCITDKNYKRIAAFHFPPITNNFVDNELTRIMGDNEIDVCIYGHLHAMGCNTAIEGIVDGIDYKLVASDYIMFKPIKLF